MEEAGNLNEAYSRSCYTKEQNNDKQNKLTGLRLKKKHQRSLKTTVLHERAINQEEVEEM